MKSVVAILALVCTITPFALAETSAPPAQKTVFIKADSGFDSDLTAAMEKKHTPLSVVTDDQKADYILEATAVKEHTESTGSKIARCLFIYCAGMEGNAAVSVRLLDRTGGTVLWAYQVRKGFSGPQARQSLSEAIAKHLKQYLDDQSKPSAKPS